MRPRLTTMRVLYLHKFVKYCKGLLMHVTYVPNHDPVSFAN